MLNNLSTLAAVLRPLLKGHAVSNLWTYERQECYLLDAPHNEGLAAAAISGSKDTDDGDMLVLDVSVLGV